MTKPAPQIVGIVLARNEDIFLRRAVTNAAAFCDHWIFADHGSRDGTPGIFRELANTLPAAIFHPIRNPADSHAFLRPLAGTNTWVFGLDGDEIYDPVGLARMRMRILSGEFSSAWMILGNVLNVTELDPNEESAAGHTSPPCRSMTKLYNFAAIDSWDGYCPERLHGGTPRFREGYSEAGRRALQESVAWENADFRCLHVCFLPRSSRDPAGAARANLMEIQGGTRLSRFTRRIGAALGLSRPSEWKDDRYRRGPLVRVSTKGFFE